MSDPEPPYIELVDGVIHTAETVVIGEGRAWVTVISSGVATRYPRERVQRVVVEIEGSVAGERR